jgi:ferrochelatase
MVAAMAWGQTQDVEGADLETTAPGGPRIGVLIGSHGDIDSAEELPDYVSNIVRDGDIVALPRWARFLLSIFRRPRPGSGIWEEYEQIGFHTGTRENSRRQVEALATLLRRDGLNATGYTGFVMTWPFVDHAMAQAQEDGVERLVVLYQGAQYSHVSTYLVFREVRAYLAEHPEWDVEVIGVRSFSDDHRFLDLVVNSIETAIDREFPEVPLHDVCVALSLHGMTSRWLDRGDPFLDQSLRAVDYVTEALADHPVYYGFQNHDDYPFTTWTQPPIEDVLEEIAHETCSHVLITGQLGFTVDCHETLYDQGTAERNHLIDEAARRGMTKEVAVQSMFNDDSEFVAYLKELTIEA